VKQNYSHHHHTNDFSALDQSDTDYKMMHELFVTTVSHIST